MLADTVRLQHETFGTTPCFLADCAVLWLVRLERSKRWQRWGEARLRGILNEDEYKVKLAISSDWPDDCR
jgi:hypothetical protein